MCHTGHNFRNRIKKCDVAAIEEQTHHFFAKRKNQHCHGLSFSKIEIVKPVRVTLVTNSKGSPIPNLKLYKLFTQRSQGNLQRQFQLAKVSL